MRKIFIFTITIFLAASGRAQSPQKISYQSVIHDGSSLVKGVSVGMKISILKGSAGGSVVYTEVQTPTANANGLVSIEIGGGNPAAFTAINWSEGPYFIKTETDPSGGTTYTVTEISQILSVPYAMYAKTIAGYPEADPVFTAWNKNSGISITASQITGFQLNVTNNPAVLTNTAKNTYPAADATKLAGINGSETKITAGTNVTLTGTGTTGSPYLISTTGHYIGEFFGGGIIVAVTNTAGVEHGLIASLTNLGPDPGSPWGDSTLIGPAAESFTDGLDNTIAIVAQPPGAITAETAAKLCYDYINPETGTGVYSDWYLPSMRELEECYHAKFAVSSILGIVNGFLFDDYWSSTENKDDKLTAYFKYFHNGILSSGGHRWHLLRVRAVRKF